MADVGVTNGLTRVAYVPAISNEAAPTTAELNAGILLHSILAADGLMGFEPKTADVDNTKLDATFDTQTIGSDSFDESGLRLMKQSGTDTAYNTLVRGTTGYIVIRRDIAASTSWASSQAVEVYPIICGTTKRLLPERNTMTRYEVPLKIRTEPTLRATVA